MSPTAPRKDVRRWIRGVTGVGLEPSYEIHPFVGSYYDQNPFKPYIFLEFNGIHMFDQESGIVIPEGNS